MIPWIQIYSNLVRHPKVTSLADELGLSNVLVIENSDEAIAKTVIANTQAKSQGILVMDSLQSVTAGDIASGKTYRGAMEGNLVSLTAALS